ncbi:hypothetical protein HMPREF9372_3126 [Sporosarcina newyorkensis 2681]|uniref:Uncharacterized protein n=1 Tax=Sporosarcina newyorkensis 2681 TaxID=1027292 RepID=F9DWE5_9BACL|nr:hypothetical protein [Sporosarcina newyorkensis]EGQ21766.1 hypothetical protein HMPREF9372_3126 [Sporosarcina newyorkensis 2681]
MIKIQTQEIEYNKDEVLQGLKQYEKKTHFRIQDVIYYPYYFFEYQVSAKSLLKFRGKTGCTVDALGGRGAMVDIQPVFSERQIEDGQVPNLVINEKLAAEIAEKFVFHNASSKAKFITMPKIIEVQRTLFYRPFWLAEFELEEKQGRLIVDAVSGSYHPL